MSMTSNTQKKWYEGMTVEEIEAVFAERERRNYAEIVAPILPDMSQTECAVCYVRDEDGGCDCRVIKCGECGTEGKKYNHTLCDDGVLRCDVCVEEDEEDEEEEHVHKVCKVCDECITCGGCGCDDEEDEEEEEVQMEIERMEQKSKEFSEANLSVVKLRLEQKITKQEGNDILKEKFPDMVSDDEDVDSRDAPNIYPYKKCSDCGERKSCGHYVDDEWYCDECHLTDSDYYKCSKCGCEIDEEEYWEGDCEYVSGECVNGDCRVCDGRGICDGCWDAKH